VVAGTAATVTSKTPCFDEPSDVGEPPLVIGDEQDEQSEKERLRDMLNGIQKPGVGRVTAREAELMWQELGRHFNRQKMKTENQ
jgi:hypothetical protein